ncbi:MAG: hypothetical protein ABSC91_10705 [Candidatus Bathyarchaeia archaeon]|jgi:predicted amidohydrolase YtcJ
MTTVSAGTAILNVADWEETADSAFHEADTWEQQQYKHKVRVYGKVHKWVLTCFEKDVSWANSAVSYFYGLQSAGTTIALGSDDPRRPISPPVSVKVAQVMLKLALEGTQNIRRFTVDFRESL